MLLNNREHTLVKCYCGEKELLKHIKRWLSEGFRLIAVSIKSDLNMCSFKAKDILDAIREDVVVFLNTISDVKCIRISMNKTEEGELLPFMYIYRSTSAMNKPMPAGVSIVRKYVNDR